MKQLLYLSLFFSLFSLSCDPVVIPEPDEELLELPSLHLEIEGDIGQDLLAGEDCVFMNTNFDQDQIGIYSFWGAFEYDQDCSQNVENLKIEIRDKEFRFDLSNISNDAISSGTFDYVNLGDSFVNFVSLTGLNCSEGDILKLEFSDGTIIDYDKINHFSELVDTNIEWIKLILLNEEEEVLSSHKYYIKNDISLDFWGGFKFSIDPFTNDILLGLDPFFTDSLGIYQYQWNDGSNGPLTLIPRVTVVNQASYTACVEIRSEGELIAEHCLSLIYDSFFDEIDYYSLLSSFNSMVLKEPKERFSEVVIEYTDQSGQFFSSGNIDNSSSFFEIEEISDFPDNENGLKSKKLKINLSCQLHSSNTNEVLSIQNAKGNVAISFPE